MEADLDYILTTNLSISQTCHKILDSSLEPYIDTDLKTILKKVIIHECLKGHRVELKNGSSINSNSIDEILAVYDLLVTNGVPGIWDKQKRFHAEISVDDILTEKRIDFLQAVLNLDYEITSIPELHDFIIMYHCKQGQELDIFNIPYKNIRKHASRKKKPQYVAISEHPKVYRELLGRIYTTLIPSTHASATKIGKVGLLMSDVSYEWLLLDINTTVVVLCMLAESSDRRSFTLQSAQRGKYSKFIHEMLEYLNGCRSTNWNLLALIDPHHLYDSSKLFVQEVFRKCLFYMKTYSYVLQHLWDIGVKNASNMICPKHGHGIDTAAWNAIADAWNNLLRYVRICCKVMNLGCFPAYKVMRLTAYDQSRWADLIEKSDSDNVADDDGSNVITDQVTINNLTINVTGGKVADDIRNNKKDIAVFKEISQIFVPWTIFKTHYMYVEESEWINSDLACDIIAAISEVCTDKEFPVSSYLGTSTTPAKVGSYKPHKNMICGITVQNLTPKAKDAMINAGVFGSNKWTST